MSDALIMVCATALAVWLHAIAVGLWWLVPVVLGHFFLFCNVFRVWRRWEYVWAVIFVINVALHFVIGSTSCLAVMLWQMPVTVIVIALQMRSPWYHGILARRINSQLDVFLNNER